MHERIYSTIKKIISIILLLVLTLSLASCYVGDGWQETPKKALSIAADATIDDSERLTPTNVLDEFYANGNAYMLFVSSRDTLVQASFVTNDKGQYHHNDYRMSKRLFSFRQADFIGFCIIKFQKI